MTAQFFNVSFNSSLGGELEKFSASEVSAAAKVPVPLVLGSSLEEAAASLQSAKLLFRTTRTADSGAAVGQVVGQDPEAGVLVADGTTVVLLVAGSPAVNPTRSGDGVIYTVTDSGNLMWRRHEGQGDGSFKWTSNTGKKVGSGWKFPHVFPGGDGVIYAVKDSGDLMWYRHEGRGDGSFKWTSNTGRKVGSGWKFPHVFSGDDGVIYAVTDDGDLMWYRHDGRDDGSFKWASKVGKKVGSGWKFPHVFSGGDGVIYAVTDTGELMWRRHEGRGDGSFKWASNVGRKVGSGWKFPHVFPGGDGAL